MLVEPVFLTGRIQSREKESGLGILYDLHRVIRIAVQTAAYIYPRKTPLEFPAGGFINILRRAVNKNTALPRREKSAQIVKEFYAREIRYGAARQQKRSHAYADGIVDAESGFKDFEKIGMLKGVVHHKSVERYKVEFFSAGEFFVYALAYILPVSC